MLTNSIFIQNKFNISKTLKRIENYEYVSFDVFDTLIKRNVKKPSDIFSLLDKYAQKYNINDFKNIRIESERKIRNKKNFVTIDDIYDEIEKQIGKEKALILKNKEISLEEAYCQANHEIVELLNILKKKNKKIIAISDMYLTSQYIKNILKNNYISIEKIYVSCECKAKKSDGTLFNYVLNNENIKPHQIIHIGDNYKADILGARLARISSIHIKKEKRCFNLKKINNKITQKDGCNIQFSVINNNIDIQKSYYAKIGFSLLGPLVFNYCYWLRNKCIINKIDKIYFFARDGYILKKAFEYLFPNEFETRYIYFSRRAIRIPYAAIHSSYEEIMKFFPKTKMLTPGIYLENLSIDVKKHGSILKKYNLKLEDNIKYKDLFLDTRYKEIFNEIYPEIINEAKQELQLLKEYLTQEKFEGRVAIVDVGWHNSMQYYLEEIAKYENIDLEMYGFYVGRLSGEKKVKHSESFIVDDYESDYAESVLSFIGLIESVFLADEGSTKTYEKSNNLIKPVLLDYEYSKNDIEYKGFEEIRTGILDYIKLVNKLEGIEDYTLDGYNSYLPFKIYGIDPYYYDVLKFSDFKYYSEEIVYFAKTKSLFYYIFHLKNLKIDLYKSRWKVGFMKALLKINLPYYKIYRKYRKKGK